MKTAAKVFLILSIVMFSFALFGLIILGFLGGIRPYLIIIGLIILSIPIFISSKALSKLKQAKTSEELKTISILVLLFVNLLAGIFMLCIKDQDLKA